MRALVLVAVLLSGCVPRAVQERLVALETRVAVLEARPVGAGPQVNEADIAARYQLANEQLAGGDVDAAVKTLQELVAQYGNINETARPRQMLSELEVVGASAGDLSDVTQWLQGHTDLSSGRHLVVFFETWCPHCRREVPQIKDRLAGRDGSALLLTRLSRDGTAEQTLEFLATNGVEAAAAVENGAIADRFAVRGIPAAAVVHDGVIVWRGHPARLEGELLDSLLPLL